MFLHAHDKVAINYKDQHISFSRLIQNAHGFSTFIPEETERIAIFAENTPQWIYAFFAGWVHNATIVPIDHMSTADEVAYILNDCKPTVLFYSNETNDVATGALAKTEHNVLAHILDDIKVETDNYSSEIEFDLNDKEKTAVIIYTSGTTGSPKGVELTYTNLLANIKAVVDVNIYHYDQRMLILLPLHHIFPLVGSMVAPLSVGASVSISPSLLGEDIMKTMADNRVTLMIGVPRLYRVIRDGIMKKINANPVAKILFKVAKKVNSRSFSRKVFKQVHQKMGGAMQFMVCGGAALDDEVAHDYWVLGFEILPGYGMTEAAPMIAFTRPDTWLIGSGGLLMPGMEVKTTDDGEIIAKGPNVMKGYFNRPEETAEVLKDGWLYTGDLGHVDENDYLFITGRKKEIIVLPSGKNINPEEIEFALQNRYPLISEAGVYQKENALDVLIFPDYAYASSQEIKDVEGAIKKLISKEFNPSVSAYKQLRKVTILNEELPRTRLSKLKRFLFEELASKPQQAFKEEQEPNSETYQLLKTWLFEEKKVDIWPSMNMETDLGMDSLEKISLQAFIETTFGFEIAQEDLYNYPTVKTLSAYIEEHKTKIEKEGIDWSIILRERPEITLPKSWFTQNTFKHVSRIFFKLYFRIKGEGHNNLPDGPVIFVPNHQSFFDGMFVSIFLKNKIFKSTYFYAKKKHVNSAIRRFLARKNNVIVLDINKDLKESLQKLAAVLEKGKNIIIFPEGTRSMDGSLGDFKKFFSILSCEFNIPVVPVAISGAYNAVPKGSIFPRPWKKIEVSFLKPIYPDNADTYDTFVDKVYQTVKQRLAK